MGLSASQTSPPTDKRNVSSPSDEKLSAGTTPPVSDGIVSTTAEVAITDALAARLSLCNWGTSEKSHAFGPPALFMSSS